VLQEMRNKAISKARAKGAVVYRDLLYADTNGWTFLWAEHPDLHCGWLNLMRMRCGSFVTAGRLARMRVLRDECLELCPLCHADIGETVEHLLLDCSFFQDEREEHLACILDQVDDEADAIKVLLGAKDSIELIRGWRVPTTTGPEMGYSMGRYA